jgi:hypothetical protein
MTQLSITEAPAPGDTTPETDWGELVTNAEYRGGQQA